MKIQNEHILTLFLAFACSASAAHTRDDDMFVTNSPSNSPTLIPDHTTQPSVKASPDPSKTPTPSPSNSAQPLVIPTKEPTLNPSKSPTTRRHTPTNEFSPCELRSSGLYGSESSEKIIVQYYYQMTYLPESDLEDLITDLDGEIANVGVKNTNMFPECNASQNQESSGEISRIVGISSSPNDKISSYCDGLCAVVEGRLTLYLFSNTRYLSIADDDVIELVIDMKSSIKDAMSNGELNSANSNILTLTYLDPSDSSIDIEDAGLAVNEKKSKGKHAGGGIPTYSYGFLTATATLSLAVVAFAVKRRKHNADDSVNESDHEALSPRKMEDNPNSLADDGSSSFFDRSGTSKLFLAWKDLNRS